MPIGGTIVVGGKSLYFAAISKSLVSLPLKHVNSSSNALGPSDTAFVKGLCNAGVSIGGRRGVGGKPLYGTKG